VKLRVDTNLKCDNWCFATKNHLNPVVFGYSATSIHNTILLPVDETLGDSSKTVRTQEYIYPPKFPTLNKCAA
jgi:hypothetical protein